MRRPGLEVPQRKIRYLGDGEGQDYSVSVRLEVGQLAGEAENRFAPAVTAAVKIVQQIALATERIS